MDDFDLGKRDLGADSGGCASRKRCSIGEGRGIREYGSKDLLAMMERTTVRVWRYGDYGSKGVK